MNFQDFFFEAKIIGSKTLSVMPSISQSSEIISITESFWGIRLILTDFLYSCGKQPASSFSRNISHHTNKITEKGVDLFIKYLLKLI